MIYTRTLKFAAVQARLRARIGKLPDSQTWTVLASNAGAELTDGLDGIGVDFWLAGLPENVSRDGLERHFMGRIRALLERAASWLPAEWDDFGGRLTLAPDIFWVTPILAGEDPGTRLDPGSRLQRVARSAPQHRRGMLEQTPFADFLDDSEAPEERWRRDLVAGVPRLSRVERRPVDRLLGALQACMDAKSADYEQLANLPEGAAETAETAAGAWRHHRALEQKLYLILAGDPFHPALILVYALLELLTMEKLRALLLSRMLGWTPPAALTGKA